MSVKLIPYTQKYFNLWNEFNSKAKNGSFLFDRSFMEYHLDRFVDASLLLYKNEKLVALLPANRVGEMVYSHQGLTYGGVITNAKLRTEDFVHILQHIFIYFDSQNIASFRLKVMPSFYNLHFSEEIKYIAFKMNAVLYRMDTSATIHLSLPSNYSSTLKNVLKQAGKHNFIIEKSLDFELFWNSLLLPVLKAKHGVAPVHALDEIVKLSNLFPENIALYVLYYEGKAVAGTVLFITETTVHVQYIAGLNTYNKLGTLDVLFDFLIHKYRDSKQYFDFGTSNENEGQQINKGLLFWKESFGAKIAVHENFEFNTAQHEALNHIFI